MNPDFKTSARRYGLPFDSRSRGASFPFINQENHLLITFWQVDTAILMVDNEIRAIGSFSLRYSDEQGSHFQNIHASIPFTDQFRGQVQEVLFVFRFANLQQFVDDKAISNLVSEEARVIDDNLSIEIGGNRRWVEELWLHVPQGVDVEQRCAPGNLANLSPFDKPAYR